MLTSLQQTWTSLSVWQRAALGAVLTAVFGGILLVARVAGRPSYGVLFANLAAEDAGAVTSKLRELKIDYQLAQGGKAIEVPADQVYDLRLTMATEGLPRGGSIGFELFDRTNFGATDFTQHLNYQRALQGELTRTINQLEGVVDSRVHLAIPEKPLFSENAEPVTASVVLHLQPGYQMDSRRVAGIVHLVSSAVEGLKPENVTVHDAQGELLSSGQGPAALSSTQAQAQEQLERRKEAELRTLAEQVLGPGKAAIRVTAELNWDQMETTSERYQPGGLNGRNLPVEEQNTTETYGDGGRPPASGSPGVASNLNAPPTARPSSRATVTENAKRYLNSQTNNHYAVNKVLQRRITAPGEIKRLSVAVLLDESVSVAKRQALRNVFAVAAGLDLTSVDKGGRGDQLALTTMPFDKSTATEAKTVAATAEKDAFRLTLIRNGAAVAVVLLLMVTSFLLLRRVRSTPRPRLDALITGDLPDSATHALHGASAASLREPAPAAPPSLADRLRELAAAQPEEVARQLQTWMVE
jgi:flagellar M-ring protein FliF